MSGADHRFGRDAVPVRLVPPDFRSARSLPAEERTGAGLATASLVLGVLSLLVNVLLAPTILAVVFGAIGLRRGTAARGRATAGIVLGVVGLAASLIGASIAIPVLLGLQAHAVDARAQSAIANDRTALVGYAAEHGGRLPKVADPAELTPYGWDDSESVRRIAYSKGSGDAKGSFCLVAVSRSGRAFVATTHTSIAAGAACPDVW